MNPILDQLLVALLMAGAVGFFVLRAMKNRKKGCAGGCCSGPKLTPKAPEAAPPVRHG